MLDPEVLAGVPEGEALQSIVQEVQQWIKNVFDALLTASPEKIGQSLQEQVEQQLYEVMLAHHLKYFCYLVEVHVFVIYVKL